MYYTYINCSWIFLFHGQPSLSYRIRVYTLPYAAKRLLLTKITLLTLFAMGSVALVVCDFRSLKSSVFRLIYLNFRYRRLFWEKFDAHLNCKTLQNKTNETERIEPQIKRQIGDFANCTMYMLAMKNQYQLFSFIFSFTTMSKLLSCIAKIYYWQFFNTKIFKKRHKSTRKQFSKIATFCAICGLNLWFKSWKATNYKFLLQSCFSLCVHCSPTIVIFHTLQCKQLINFNTCYIVEVHKKAVREIYTYINILLRIEGRNTLTM